MRTLQSGAVVAILFVAACSDLTVVRLFEPVAQPPDWGTEAGGPGVGFGGTSTVGGAGQMGLAGKGPSLGGSGGGLLSEAGGIGGQGGACRTWRNWVLDFGSDPTATDHDGDGLADWAMRSGGSFPLTQLQNGEWHIPSGTVYTIDTRPLYDFKGRTMIDTAMQSLDVPGADDNTVFWVNVNQNSNGASGIFVSIAQVAGHGQTIELKTMDDTALPHVVLTRVTDLPDRMIQVHLDIDPPAHLVTWSVDGVNHGTFPCPALSGTISQRAATVRSAGAAIIGRSTVSTCVD